MPGAVGNRNGNEEIKKLMTKKIDKLFKNRVIKKYGISSIVLTEMRNSKEGIVGRLSRIL